MNNDTIKMLFIGDIVGKPGRRIVKDYLENYKFDFVVANVENASHGFGLTKKNYDELSSYGIDAMTSGNHIWDKKEVFEYINKSDKLIRPLNYPNCEWGEGYQLYNIKDTKIAVINLLGRTFMAPVDSPFETTKDLITKIQNKADIIFIDFHAEATAEKISFANYAKELGVTAVFCTHTHVQTADEKILDNKTAYITDAGFCGAFHSIIGMDVESSIKRWTTCIHDRLDVVDSKIAQFNAVKVDFDIKTHCPKQVERVFFVKDFSEAI